MRPAKLMLTRAAGQSQVGGVGSTTLPKYRRR